MVEGKTGVVLVEVEVVAVAVAVAVFGVGLLEQEGPSQVAGESRQATRVQRSRKAVVQA